MIKLRPLVLLLLLLLPWQSIVQAASISTRVRILESKVKKIDRSTRHQTIVLKKQDRKFAQGLKSVKHLEDEVAFLKHQQQLILRRTQPKKSTSFIKNGSDVSNYSFP